MLKPRVFKASVYRLKNYEYNIVRSFVESSTKETYPWNQCVEMPPELSPEDYNIVECEKTGKWRLMVMKPKGNHPKRLMLISLKKPESMVVQAEYYTMVTRIRVGSYDFNIATLDVPLTAVIFAPEEPDKVPYWKPFTLADVLAKVEFYAQV